MNSVFWVLPGLLAGRAGPGEEPWDLAELRAGGFRAIVSLDGLRDPQIEVAGFRHYRVMLNGGLAFASLLRRWLARSMVPVIDFIADEVGAGNPTLVHCRQGRDRTGAVLAAFMVRERGLDPAEAVRLVRSANPKAMISVGFDRLPELFAVNRRRRTDG